MIPFFYFHDNWFVWYENNRNLNNLFQKLLFYSYTSLFCYKYKCVTIHSLKSNDNIQFYNYRVPDLCFVPVLSWLGSPQWLLWLMATWLALFLGCPWTLWCRLPACCKPPPLWPGSSWECGCCCLCWRAGLSIHVVEGIWKFSILVSLITFAINFEISAAGTHPLIHQHSSSGVQPCWSFVIPGFVLLTSVPLDLDEFDNLAKPRHVGSTARTSRSGWWRASSPCWCSSHELGHCCRSISICASLGVHDCQ